MKNPLSKFDTVLSIQILHTKMTEKFQSAYSVLD